MSLRRTAAELLTMPRTTSPEPARALDEAGRDAQTEIMTGAAGRLRLVRPALALSPTRRTWPASPHPWGSDIPVWAS